MISVQTARVLFRVVWSGLRAQMSRLLLTAAAIAGGAGFLAGTFVYADTARTAFYDQLARSARNVDVVVLPPKGDVRQRVTPEIEAGVKGLAEVSQVDGRVVETLGMLDPAGKLISNEGFAGYAISLPKDPDLARFDLVEGRLPQAAGEVAIDKSTAERYGFDPGGTARFVNDNGAYEATIVGVIDLGVNRGVTGLSVAAFTDADLAKLLRPNGCAELVVRAKGDPAQARQAVRAAVPPEYEVLSGEAWRHRLAVESAKYVDGFHRVLLGFSVIALAVAVFVIYNTSSPPGAPVSWRFGVASAPGEARSGCWC
jgi:putative ABC transport system permease protein